MKIKKWKDKVIYQIFPRSFYDSNNDGDGDINGITEKLDYLKDLGVDAIWLCPTYDTDFEDAGYDVKDYKSVWKQFGTLEDFKKMTKEAKKRGIDIIMDIVLNHVSDQHEWFKKAIESTDNVEHNYFIWREELNKDEKDAPSIFGGSAWEYVPSVKKYYFHLFSKAQVDLNWDHPDTINAMADVVDFWYKLGVKGFRLDAIKHISKDFPEGIKTEHSWGSTTVKNLQKFNNIAFKGKDDAFILGEASSITLEEAIKYGTGKEKVSSNYYNFSWWWIGWGNDTGRNGYNPDWTIEDFVKGMKRFQESKRIKPELMTNFLSNHDTARAISRWGDEGVFWKESSKSLALMMFTLKGIPSIYYGEEIGMLNPVFNSRKDFRDVDALNAYSIWVDQKKYYTEDEMTKYHNINGRDNSRTPMQWSGAKNSGFNKGKKTWIKLGNGFKNINVETQKDDKTSIFHFYKEAIKLRKSKAYGTILVDGTSKMEYLPNELIKVTRKHEGKTIITILNITKNSKEFKLPKYKKVLIRSWSDNKKVSNKLRPYESIMFSI